MSDKSKSMFIWLGTVILPLLAIIVTISIYLLSKDDKSLSYEIFGQYQLVNSELSVDDVEIKYLGNTVNNLEFISFRLTNFGDIPITADDFEREIKVSFSKDSIIYSLKKGESSPQNLDPILKNEGNFFTVSPILLNPGDSFVVELILTGDMLPPEVDARIAGVRSITDKPTFKHKDSIEKTIDIMFPIALSLSSFLYAILSYLFFIPFVEKTIDKEVSMFSNNESLAIVFLAASCPSLLFIVRTNMGLNFQWVDSLLVIIPIILGVAYMSFRKKDNGTYTETADIENS